MSDSACPEEAPRRHRPGPAGPDRERCWKRRSCTRTTGASSRRTARPACSGCGPRGRDGHLLAAESRRRGRPCRTGPAAGVAGRRSRRASRRAARRSPEPPVETRRSLPDVLCAFARGQGIRRDRVRWFFARESCVIACGGRPACSWPRGGVLALPSRDGCRTGSAVRDDGSAGRATRSASSGASSRRCGRSTRAGSPRSEAPAPGSRRERGAAARPSAAPAPAPGPRPAGAAAISKVFNPDIAAIGNFVGAAGQSPGGGEPSLNMQEAELSFQAVVDPYARADFFVTLGPEEVALEEGYITFPTLPGGLPHEGRQDARRLRQGERAAHRTRCRSSTGRS